jgi:hypothetical protein
MIKIAAVLLALYGLVCAVRDLSALGRGPVTTYKVGDHIIEVRTFPGGWSGRYTAMIDGWEEMLTGYDSAQDAILAGQAAIKQMDRDESKELIAGAIQKLEHGEGAQGQSALSDLKSALYNLNHLTD